MREMPQVQQRIKDAIDDSADGSVPLPDLLRRLFAVGSRVDSEELQQWARQELYGYDGANTESLPHYRRDVPLEMTVAIISPQDSITNILLTPRDIPDEKGARQQLFFAHLSNPVSELTNMAKQGFGIDRDMTPEEMKWLQTWGKDQRLLNEDIYTIRGAERRLTRITLNRICDDIRTAAVEICLAIEKELPSAELDDTSHSGQSDGRLLSVNIDNITVQIITGNNASDISQQAQIIPPVTKDNHESLMSALAGIGLDKESRDELSAAIKADDDSLGEHTESLLTKVRRGGLELSTNMSGSIAAGLITNALSRFIGLS